MSKHPERDYSKIALPYNLPHWKLSFALEEIRPYWDKLPSAFLHKFMDAYNTSGKALAITSDDLDSLSDDMWRVLLAKL